MRTPKGRIWGGLLMIIIGGTAAVIALGPLAFLHRFADRVDVVGEVQEGYSADTVVGETISNGEYGVWKVDYELGSSQHVGFILGSYDSGQQISVSVPASGSVYGLLRESVSTFGKVMSWPLMLLGTPLAIAGVVVIVIAVRDLNRQVRAEVRARLAAQGLLPPALAGPAAAPTWQSTTQAPPPTYAEPFEPGQPPAPDAQNPFFKPYDV